VLDASVVAGWFLERQKTDYTRAVLEFLSRRGAAVVPAMWWWEVANLLSIAVRRGLTSYEDAQSSFETLSGLSIETDGDGLKHAFKDTFFLAHRYQRTAYDAAYLELALRKGLPLATKDEALRGAAVAAGVVLFEPELDAVE
jgi:predicted nucleic acid-binding protein